MSYYDETEEQKALNLKKNVLLAEARTLSVNLLSAHNDMCREIRNVERAYTTKDVLQKLEDLVNAWGNHEI